MSAARFACDDCDWAGDRRDDAAVHVNRMRHSVTPDPHRLLPADHPVDGPRDEHGNITAPESPDWHARYEGYAFRQIRRVRDTMARDLTRDLERGHLTTGEIARARARLASYDDLIITLDHLKGQLK